MKTSRRTSSVALRLALLCVTLALLVSMASAQQMAQAPPDGEQIPQAPPGLKIDLPMQTILFDAEQLAAQTTMPLVQLRQEMEDRGITLDGNGRVHVEIVGPPGSRALSAEVIEKTGGEVTNTWLNRVEAWIPIGQLSGLARVLPPGYFLERASTPLLDQVAGEGPVVTNSADYRDHGADCGGVTVAVIDAGYTGLAMARTNGDAPSAASTTQINYTPNPFEDDDTHGTGCTEALFDHCPDATWRLYKIDSLTDLGAAVTDAINHNVDVISHSLSWYNTGWEDDSGGACAAATDAADDGILFFTAAGNYAEAHWQGSFDAGSNMDSWHDWVDGDWTIDIIMPGSGTGRFFLSWDTSGDPTDYDLYLFDATLTGVIAKSTNGGNAYEEFTWTNPNPTIPLTVHLAVARASGGTAEMEVILAEAGTWLQYAMPENATLSPSNCTHGNIVSVGAVEHGDYGSAPGTVGIIEDYSSQGPSNSGMTLPDLVGPTDTTGFTYPLGFGGTSCATPNLAGATAAFWSSAPLLSAEGVRYLIFEQAGIFKDWGAVGSDNIYGRGGVWLHTYHPDTVWVDRRAGNAAGLPTLPYYYVAHAQVFAADGGRVVFLGQGYPEPITLYRDLVYETIGWPARLGSP
jgi:hypothetical protein